MLVTARIRALWLDVEGVKSGTYHSISVLSLNQYGIHQSRFFFVSFSTGSQLLKALLVSPTGLVTISHFSMNLHEREVIKIKIGIKIDLQFKSLKGHNAHAAPS